MDCDSCLLLTGSLSGNDVVDKNDFDSKSGEIKREFQSEKGNAVRKQYGNLTSVRLYLSNLIIYNDNYVFSVKRECVSLGKWLQSIVQFLSKGNNRQGCNQK